MKIKLETGQLKKGLPLLLLTGSKNLERFFDTKDQARRIQKQLEDNKLAASITPGNIQIFIKVSAGKNRPLEMEALRRAGAEAAALLTKENAETIGISGEDEEASLALAEGLLLASYRFTKYKNEKKQPGLKKIILTDNVSREKLRELESIVEAVYLTRDLVNEPVSYLTAVRLSEELRRLGKEAGFEVEVLQKKKIEALKMGGLLGVNQGSVDPPTFNILRYKHPKAVNKAPIVLAGKGVVYDTGGLSLKDSTGMILMKSDMAGAAAVAGAFYAAARNKLPVNLIGLIPATDNRPSGNALAPGDIITISNGKTVEVLNTDAEGRLILADALVYASTFKPMLVIDLATLTGAAASAIGPEGIVFMGDATEKIKSELRQSGEEVHERLVEFPLWEEYGKQLRSDIADIKNLGEGYAGAITAGKFLEYFVDYDWLHLDIAGPAFLKSADYYRSKNGTGVGVRLLYHFLKKQVARAF